MASMHRKVSDACRGEAQAISNAKAKIVKLEKSFWGEIRDLKAKADGRIQ